MDEVTVSSSRTGHTDRFVCKEPLGALGAGFLSPVPPGAVVYGSGETAVVLTKVRGHWQALQLNYGILCGRCCWARGPGWQYRTWFAIHIDLSCIVKGQSDRACGLGTASESW